MTLVEVALLVAGGAVASLVRVKGGFGFSLIAFPILASFLNISTTRLGLSLCELTVGLIIVFREGRTLWHYPVQVFLLACGAVGGVLIGRLLLGYMSEEALFWIGIGSAMFGAILLIRKVKIRPGLIAQFLGAFVSGVLGMFCGVSGPPLMLVLFGHEEEDWLRIRNALVVYFLFLYLAVVVFQFVTWRAPDLESMIPVLLLAVGALFGTYISYRTKLRFEVNAWRRIAAILILGGSIAATYSRFRN